ncbi:DNA (cytosine-5-)-methyltransferase [Candidatus Binatia bacterium]|nr:DNA (cytosine-5-)-methyltransferase [Microbacteriaceae bacterium]MBY0280441.1 DNA (cytosine-5-)-methyltransferase [Candidatus Binatia bacterium]
MRRSRSTSARTSPLRAIVPTSPPSEHRRLDVVGLFAGIGGIELGLSRSGHRTHLLCEIEPAAVAVLRARMPGVRVHEDVRTLRALPRETDLITAGFPCQDLSQAGMTAGLAGRSSGLIGEVLRLLERRRRARRGIPLVLIENVPFMLQLGRGRALEVIIDALEELGYRWAYRVVDTLAFGLPQRRERVFLAAALDEDPRKIVLSDDAGPPDPVAPTPDLSFGFYWTEGVRGLGAAVDSIPTLKGGSTIGIPSPPAIILPTGRIVTPGITDAERLQGFDEGWTEPAEAVARRSHRWKLVGNAVTVNVAEWLGRCLAAPGPYDGAWDAPMSRKSGAWPRAAWGADGKRFESTVSSWPVAVPRSRLDVFLRDPCPLSLKATAGFWSRFSKSSLRRPPWVDDAIVRHIEWMATRKTSDDRARAATAAR